MKKTSARQLLKWLALASIMALCRSAQAQGTAFSYQGRLTDGGNLANGQYDMQFKLYDTMSVGSGAQQGPTVTVNNIIVTSGVFTTELDFGPCATCFDGTSRFLEIAVKKTIDATYTTLSPRQQITSTPYAVRSLNAAMADGLSVACINCITSSQIQSVNGSALTGTIPVASVPDLGASYIKNNTSQQATSNFNISGSGTADIFNATTQYNLGGARILSAPGTNNLFAGPGAGQANASGSGNVFVGDGAGQANTVGLNNSFFGVNAGLNNVGFISQFTGQVTTGKNNSFFGANAGKSISQGTDNSFFGNNAGGSSTPGDQNSFFGSNAGSASRGDANAFFGLSAGSGNNGTRNSFFGVDAGAVGNGGAASGDDNSFFGTFAGENNTASGNAFFGSGAGQANTTGNGNAFFGYQAGLNNNSGARNTFIGAGAGNTNSGNQGSDSTAIGANAVVIPCGAGESVAVGSGASANCASTAIGKGATASGPASIAIGDGATASALGSIAIGNGASVSTDSTIVIGRTHGSQVTVPGAMSIGFGVETVGTTVLVANGGLLFNTNGFLGVGTLSPARELDVHGRARVESIPQEPSIAAVCFNAAGDLLQCGASSLRWKRDIQPFTGGLDIVLRLRPISFNWKESGLADIGLGAEEVAQVAPSFIFTNTKGEISGVKYERLNILFINAIKEQQQQIEQVEASNHQQQAQIKQQQTQIKRQQIEIDALKKLMCLDHPRAEICKVETKP